MSDPPASECKGAEQDGDELRARLLRDKRLDIGCEVDGFLRTFDWRDMWNELDHTRETWEMVTVELLCAVHLHLFRLMNDGGSEADLIATREFLYKASPLLLLAQCVAPMRQPERVLDSPNGSLGTDMNNMESIFYYKQKIIARKNMMRVAMLNSDAVVCANNRTEVMRVITRNLPRPMAAQLSVEARQDALYTLSTVPLVLSDKSWTNRLSLAATMLYFRFKLRAEFNESRSQLNGSDPAIRLLYQLMAWQRGLGRRLSRLASTTEHAVMQERLAWRTVLEDYISTRDVANIVLDYLADDLLLATFHSLADLAHTTLMVHEGSRVLDAFQYDLA
jgi:hypothetical protein